MRISSSSALALARISPEVPATKLWPQNSMPSPPTGLLVADAVDGGDVAAVGDGVAALDGFPGVVLLRAVLGFLARMPADGGGVEEDLRALQRGEPRGFGIPLVPADQHADLAVARLPGAEAEVAGREIELLVVKRVVRDVHLAVDAQQRAVGVNDRGGVVIDAGGALLEQRGDDDDLVFAGELLKGRGARAGNRLGQFEIRVVFALAEILRAEQFLRADDLRAVPGGAFGAARAFSSDWRPGSAEQAVWIRPSLTMRAGAARFIGTQALAWSARRCRSRMIGAARGVAGGAAGPVWPNNSRMNLPSVSLVGP